MRLVRLFLAFAVLLVLGWSSVAGATPYYDAVMADNPVSYWRLDDGAPGAIYGDPDTARSYDSSGAITIAYDPALNASIFSVEAWAQFNSDCTNVSNCYSTILSSRGGSTHFSGYQLGAHPVPGGGESLHLGWAIGAGGTWHGGNQSTPVRLGDWYHFVLTYDGSTQRVYVNGALSGTVNSAFTPNVGAPLFIGEIGPSGTQYPLTNGLIDEVAYYDYALSGDRVSAHYQTGIGVIPEPSTALLLGFGLVGLAIRRRV